MNNVVLSILSAAALLISYAPHAVDDVEAGKSKSATCAACHGATGNSINPQWPNLAGQNAQYTYKQMRDFKDGARSSPIMTAQVIALSDEDMQDLAAYYASLQAQVGSVEESKLILGESIYRGGNITGGVAACMGCHGPAGEGNPAAKYPRLSGQQATYTAAQLRMFKNGQRHNDEAKMMRSIASRMNDEEIDAVASYISGLY